MNLALLANWHKQGYRLIGHHEIGESDNPFIGSVDDMVVYMSVRDALEIRGHLPVEIHLTDTSQDAALLKPLRESAKRYEQRKVVKL